MLKAVLPLVPNAPADPAGPKRAAWRALGAVAALNAGYLLAAGSSYVWTYIRQHGWGTGALTACAVLGLEALMLLAPAWLLAGLLRRRGWPRAAVAGALGWLAAADLLFRVDAVMVSTFAQHVYGTLAVGCLKQGDAAALAFTGRQMALYALEAALVLGLQAPAFLLARRIFLRRCPGPFPRRLRRAARAAGALLVAVLLFAWGASRLGPNREALLALEHGFLVPLSLGPEGRPPREVCERAQESFRRALAAPAQEPAWLAPVEISRPPDRRPNIVMVYVESLRADAFEPQTMPEMCRFAGEATRAPRHYADGNTTYLSLFSLAYGRSPLGWDLAKGRKSAPPPLAALKKSGYRLHAISSCSLKWWGLDQVVFPRRLFDTWIDRDEKAPVEDDLASTADALRVIDGAGKDGAEPFFLFVFLYSTHWTYYFPPDCARFEPFFRDIPNHIGPELAERREEVRNRSRNAAFFVDRCAGRIVARLRERALLDNTIVVFSADHGESFYETKSFIHGNSLAEQEIRVPLAVRWPGRAPREVAGFTQHADLFPAIFKFMGLESPQLAGGPGGTGLLDGEGASWVAVGAAKDGSPERWMLRDERRRLIFRLPPGGSGLEVESWRDGTGLEGRALVAGDDPAEIERLGGCLDRWLQGADAAPLHRLARETGLWGRVTGASNER